MSKKFEIVEALTDHMACLFLALVKVGGYKSFYRKHTHEKWDVVYLMLPTGQVSYWVPNIFRKEYENISILLTEKDENIYDGHGYQDVLNRLLALPARAKEDKDE